MLSQRQSLVKKLVARKKETYNIHAYEFSDQKGLVIELKIIYNIDVTNTAN